jgi:hypothetical protein
VRVRIAVAGIVCCASTAAGCTFGPEEIAHLSASESVTIEVVDERGQPVVGAAYDYGGLSAFSARETTAIVTAAGCPAG